MPKTTNHLLGSMSKNESQIDFRTTPSRYRHWRLNVEPPLAVLSMDVDEQGGLMPGYELKLNSYDLGVDIELNDAVQRLRFEYPNVGAVIVTSQKDRIFCAGANIGMLSKADHFAKVNFCKFSNETRCAIEQASSESGQRYLAVVNGPASGGGYELALACDHIMLVDDGASTVSLPEIPLLGVLPGTGGLTRLIEKRRVRRDRADLFCTTTEGISGQRALEWALVDELIPASQLYEKSRERAIAMSQNSTTTLPEGGICWSDLERELSQRDIKYPSLTVDLDGTTSTASFRLFGPDQACPDNVAEAQNLGIGFWPLKLARALDDAILHLRTNRPDINNWIFRVFGDGSLIREYDYFLVRHGDSWLLREIRLYWTRVLKRLDVTSRSLMALVEGGDGFSGTLFEVALACDRIYMLDDNKSSAISLTEMNFGRLLMANGLSRLETRFLNDRSMMEKLHAASGKVLKTNLADQLGLTTATPDEIDWDEEIRLVLEERTSFSGDALTGMEANLRFGGPETLETKIFGRLSAWQNWIFQRPNAVGPDGALRTYGTGRLARFDKTRV